MAGSEKISSILGISTADGDYGRRRSVSHFVHIPKTGGTSVRSMMPEEYRENFPWGDGYTNRSCGVVMASTFHMTLAELRRCGLRPPMEPGLVLCIVRDPIKRFASEIRWQKIWQFQDLTGRELVEKAKKWCEQTGPLKYHDHYAHCRPQARYLNDENGNDECDILISDPSRHSKLLTSILPGDEVPHINRFERKKPEFTFTQASYQPYHIISYHT
uniref:Sulfotransferase family protein n=1 Tax=Lotharella oceanica TaxID=641309 RepID=A0A7S2U589_9EUKA|mmetsp:Transcript_8041/g.15806  ORF Transcript_8041/g.15806 Transcript_8041/m.15806 type:complete len:216 (+) Transcript_8041:722-1369(+)